MAEIKKINTEFQLLDKFLDTSGDAGTSGQVLSSTATGINWVSGSNLPGGPYLPLAGGTMTGDLKLNDNVDLYIGTGNDFQAYHDGSNTYLRNLNGSFVIKQDKVDADLILESDNGSGGTTPYLTLDGSTTHAYFSNPGNVGIGTTSPSSKFQVSANDGDGITLKHGTSNAFYILRDGSDDTIIKQTRNYTSKISISTLADSGTHESSGLNIVGQGVGLKSNVGIGTSSPAEKLEVYGGNLIVNDGTSKSRLRPSDLYMQQAGVIKAWLRADGNSYLNGGNLGIGTTSPAYILDVVSPGAATARLKSAGTGAISLRYENGGGFKSAAVVDNNGLYRLDATNISLNPTNNVGIGTTSPSAKLEVNGNVKVGSGAVTDNNSLIVYGNNGTASKYIKLIHHNASSSSIQTDNTYLSISASNYIVLGSNALIYQGVKFTNDKKLEYQESDNSYFTVLNANSSNLVQLGSVTGVSSGGDTALYHNGSEKVRITSGGVGIGTTSPSNVLTIETDSNAKGIDFDAGGTRLGSIERMTIGSAVSIGLEGANGRPVSINNNHDSQVLIANGGGNVGVGTTNPSHKLTIAGTTTHTTARVLTTTGNANLRLSTDNSDFSIIGQGGSNRFDIFDVNANSTRLSINSSGNVGIGTTSPATTGGTAKLTVNVGSGTSSPVSIVNGTTDGMYIRRYATNGQYQIQTTVGGGNSGNLSLQSYGGNVGIGTTSPQSSFKLDVNGNVITRGSAYVLTDLNHYGTNDFDIKASQGLTDIKFTAGGAERVRIKRQGNVGIGTTSPGTKLHVNGGIITVNDGTGITYYEGVKINSYDSNGYDIIGREGLTLSTVSADKDIILSPTGNVGIGTTNPSEKLEVDGYARVTALGINSSPDAYLSSLNARLAVGGNIVINTDLPQLYLRANSTSNTSDIRYQNSLKLTNGSGSTHLTVTSTGNVGVGTTSPGQKLHVSGVVQSDRFFVGTNASANQWAVQVRNNASTADSGIYFNNNSSEIYLRNSSNVIGARIRSNSASYFNGGDVGIGIASPQERLHVSGETHPSIKLSSSSDGNYNVILNCGYRNEALNLSVGGYKVFTTEGYNTPESTYLWSNNSKALYLASNQAATFTSTVTATNFINSSDERLKENIEEVCNNNIEVSWKTFNFKTEKEQKRYGVIAQELEKTNPEFVREDSQGFKSVAYIDLLIAKIAELEARIQKLEK